MAANKGYTFATENEEEMNEWINAFKAALKKNSQENSQAEEILDKGITVLCYFFSHRHRDIES